jgi:hypothetical protein
MTADAATRCVCECVMSQPTEVYALTSVVTTKEKK